MSGPLNRAHSLPICPLAAVPPSPPTLPPPTVALPPPTAALPPCVLSIFGHLKWMVAIGPVKQVTHDRGPVLWAPEQRPLWGHGRSLRWSGILGLRKRQGHDWSLWELELCPL
jgi:hypothetical protein